MKPSHSKELYALLISESIINSAGRTTFELNGIKTTIKDSSVVGNIIQEWLKAFMLEKDILFRVKNNTQEFPDFFMDIESDRYDLLEVKCFKKSPNFDVANFHAYCRSLRESPYRLDANYLIFKYESRDDGTLIIKDIWLKKVWEICSKSDRSALKIQWKQSVPVNIRPATWYSKKTKYSVFESRQDFVSALSKVVNTNAAPEIQNKWKKVVEDKYKEQTGRNL